MIPAEQALTILARQAVSALGLDVLQDIGKHVENGATGTFTLNFYEGAIPSWSMLERHEKRRKEPIA